MNCKMKNEMLIKYYERMVIMLEYSAGHDFVLVYHRVLPKGSLFAFSAKQQVIDPTVNIRVLYDNVIANVSDEVFDEWLQETFNDITRQCLLIKSEVQNGK